jgi:hypothetical protein
MKVEDRIRDLYAAGVSVPRIARAVDCDHQLVRRVAKQKHADGDSLWAKRQRQIEEQVQSIRWANRSWRRFLSNPEYRAKCIAMWR